MGTKPSASCTRPSRARLVTVGRSPGLNLVAHITVSNIRQMRRLGGYTVYPWVPVRAKLLYDETTLLAVPAASLYMINPASIIMVELRVSPRDAPLKHEITMTLHGFVHS